MKKEKRCCPKFNPKPWDNKKITWNNKLFIKDHVTSIFHIPINFGKVAKINFDKIKKFEAEPSEPILLADENSKWGSDVYFAVRKDIPTVNIVKFTGTYITRVYEGPYRNLKDWIADMIDHVESKGKIVKRLYFYYTTCPKCAKFYGKNYVVILAQV